VLLELPLALLPPPQLALLLLLLVLLPQLEPPLAVQLPLLALPVQELQRLANKRGLQALPELPELPEPQALPVQELQRLANKRGLQALPELPELPEPQALRVQELLQLANKRELQALLELPEPRALRPAPQAQELLQRLVQELKLVCHLFDNLSHSKVLTSNRCRPRPRSDRWNWCIARSGSDQHRRTPSPRTSRCRNRTDCRRRRDRPDSCHQALPQEGNRWRDRHR
jgi:hypothetical protein